LCGAGLFTAAQTAPTHLVVPRLWWERRLSCLERSIYQWADCLEPFHQTGNRERTTISGVDLLSHIIYITAWPDATLDKMRVFIYNEGGGLYSCPAISKRLGMLNITKKRASIEGLRR
jgi:hypothetical protein